MRSKEVTVTVRVLDPAYLDAAADALSDRGMRVHWRKRDKRGAMIGGSVLPALIDVLKLVVGCEVTQ